MLAIVSTIVIVCDGDGGNDPTQVMFVPLLCFTPCSSCILSMSAAGSRFPLSCRGCDDASAMNADTGSFLVRLRPSGTPDDLQNPL